MEEAYVLSYDVGTSGVKTVLVDLDGNVAGIAFASYGLLTPQPGWAEQDPAAYWNGVCTSTKQALQQTGISPNKIRGIAFSTQWKGIIPVDERDQVLHNNIIWLDNRAVRQATRLNQKLNGELLRGDDYWPKVLWVKEELPAIYAKTKSFLEVNAFLKFKATGEKCVDLTNNFVHTANPDLQTYYSEIQKAADVDLGKFPTLVMSTEKVGEVTARAAEEMGILAGTPVFGGCGDIPAITIGSGRCSPGDFHIYLGSSGWLAVVSKRVTSRSLNYVTFEKDKDINLLGGTKAAGMSFNWAIDQFYRAEKETLKEGIYEYVNKDIQNIPPGSGNLLATPWYYGDFPPVAQNAKSVFLNISGQHDRRYMIHAVLEGICYQMRWYAEIYHAQTGKSVNSLRIVGGGANGGPWMQMMADVLGRPIEVPENPSHVGALGTAYCTFIGIGLCSDFSDVKRKVRVKKTYQPRAEYAKIYDDLYGQYTNISPMLEPLFSALNK
ncbi:MAG: carbohydrate kinase [Anaerolineales bacterium]|nr:MAG: carbohydrate kinase [Anaerolineales bacterium]